MLGSQSAVVGAAASVPTAAPVPLQCRPGNVAASNVQHLIVIIPENHSFDTFFGAYCTAAAGTSPVCNYGPSCCEAPPLTVSGVKPVTLTKSQNINFDPNHSQSGELCEINGGLMNKYISGCSASSSSNFAVADATTLATYFSYASQYAIADRHFQSSAGASSQNDMYFARGAWVFDDNAYVPNSKVGSACYSSGSKVSYTDKTIADLLVTCGVSWSFYIEGYSVNPTSSQCYPSYYDSSDVPFAYYPSVADNPLYFKDYTQFASDVSAGKLPAVSYFKSLGIHSEHPGISTLAAGQTFADAVVQVILKSALYAANTLIIITPDESGGYYDHIPTPPTNPVDMKPYGPRTPFIAVGNLVKKNYISHVQIEPSSIIKFIEWNFLAGGTGQVRRLCAYYLLFANLVNRRFVCFAAWNKGHKREQYR